MAQKIALVLGAGPNIGTSTVKTFKANGYKVAYASRKADDAENDDSTLALKCDLFQPKSVETVFQTVRTKWGEPSVVVYNAYAAHRTTPEETFNVPTETFEQHLALNTTSVFVAIREAISGFSKLSGPKTFILTGNMSNEGGVPSLLTLCVGKAAGAYMVQFADSLSREKDIRLYFVDERTAEGKPMYKDLGGQAHADMFLSLVERKADLPWQVTFVSGKGYVEFSHELIL